MADRTTAQAGDPTVGANWVGGVAPGIGDRAIVQHAMSLPAGVDWPFGDSPAAGVGAYVLDIKSTGSLTLAAGSTVTARGDVMIRNGSTTALTNNGGTFQLDGSVSGAAYQLYLVEFNSSQRPITAGPGATFRSHPDGPPGRFWGTGSRSLYGTFEGEPGNPITFERLGGPSWPIAMANGALTLSDVVFRQCGRQTVTGGAAPILYQRVTILNPNLAGGERGVEFTSNSAGATGHRHRLVDCAFPSGCFVYFPLLTEVEAEDCTFLGGVGRAGGAGSARVWKNPTIPTQSNYSQMCTTEEGGYYLSPADNANSHNWVFQFAAPGYLTRATVEFLNDSAAGDPATDGEVTSSLGQSNYDLHVSHLLAIPPHDGHMPNLASFLSDAGTGRLYYDHVTGASGPAGSIIRFGHPGDNGGKTDRAVLTNSIAAGFADALGAGKTGYYTVDVVDSILAANAHHNVGHRVIASRYVSALGLGYGAKQSNPAAAMGADDLDVDPWLHWPTDPAARRAILPRLRTWAAHIGLTGTGKEKEAAALTAIHLRHVPGETGHVAGVTATSLRDWVRSGWAPSNALLAGSASDGTDRGAIAYAAPPGEPALPDAEVGDTGPFVPDGNNPDWYLDHITPRLGINEFFQQGDSPLKLLCTPTIATPKYRHSDAMMAFTANNDLFINSWYFQGGNKTGMPLSVCHSSDLTPLDVVFEGPNMGEVSPYHSDPGPYPFPPGWRSQNFPHPRPPVGSLNEGEEGDGHAIVVDADTGWVYEAYRAYLKEDGKLAVSGAHVYNLLTGDWAPHVTDPDHPNYVAPGGHRFPYPLINAAGLPMLPLCARYEEIYEYGEINHKIGMTFSNRKITGQWWWPAQGAASSNNGKVIDHEYGLAIPYGATLRIKPEWYRANVHDFEIQTVGGVPRAVHVGPPLGPWPAGTRVVLKAFLEYGAINTDGGDTGGLWVVADGRYVAEEKFANDLIYLFFISLGVFEVVDPGDDDNLLTYEVTPTVAPEGTPREIAVTCHLWDRHPEAHPGKPDYLINGQYPFRYNMALKDAGTKNWLVGSYPSSGEAERATFTPDDPVARFDYTPTSDTPRFFAETTPPGLPWRYADDSWGVWTTAEDVPTVVTIVPPPGSDYDAQTNTLTVEPGATLTLSATMTGATGSSFIWRAPLGGLTVDAFSGALTAGSTPGTYSVAASPAANTLASGTLTVVVADDEPPPTPSGAGLSHAARRRLLLMRAH